MVKFHERLKQLKDESGYTQAKIAEDLGITPQAFSYFVNGREPNYELLLKISKYFNVSLDYLLGISDYKDTKYLKLGTELGLDEPTIKTIDQFSRTIDLDTGITLGQLFNSFVQNDKFSKALRALLSVITYSDTDWEEVISGLRQRDPDGLEQINPELMKMLKRAYVKDLISQVADEIEKNPPKPKLNVEHKEDGSITISK